MGASEKTKKRSNVDLASKDASNILNGPLAATVKRPLLESLVVAAGVLIGCWYFLKENAAQEANTTTTDDVDEGSISEQHVRHAGYAVFTLIVIYSVLHVRDFIYTRPFPALWRFFFGVMTCHSLLMLFLLFMPNRSAAHRALSIIYPDIGSLAEYDRLLKINIESVMGSCVFTRETLKRQLLHCPWFLCHSLGYMAKTVVFRSWKVAFIAGLLFELCEVTFTYFIPEFEECWWDSAFLDTFGGNLIGVWMGVHVCKWMYGQKSSTTSNASTSSQNGANGKTHVGNGQSLSNQTNGTNTSTYPPQNTDTNNSTLVNQVTYDWMGRTKRKTLSSSLLTAASPFSTRYEYKIFSSATRMIQVAFMIFLMVLLETNQFLLNNTLGVPNTSAFTPVRLSLIAFVGVPAAAEWYNYTVACESAGEHRRRVKVQPVGPCGWLLVWVALIELAVFTKFFPDHMRTEIEKTGNQLGIPHDILTPHLISGAILLIWMLFRYQIVGYTNLAFSIEEEKTVRKVLKTQAKAGWWRNFQTLPLGLKFRVLMVELVDVLLVLGLLPLTVLFRMNWKWE